LFPASDDQSDVSGFAVRRGGSGLADLRRNSRPAAYAEGPTKAPVGESLGRLPGAETQGTNATDPNPMLKGMVSPRKTNPLTADGCLFCLRADGGFVSREHIFSEAFGNVDEKVLPPGVVCDRCNNGPLALADEELVNFPPISLLRAERGIPTKAGKPVESKWGNAKVRFPEHGTLELVEPSRAVRRAMGPPGRLTGPHKLQLKAGFRLTEDRVSRMVRSIWKSGLECVYLDHGAEAAFHQIFSGVRTAIVDCDAEGWAVLPSESNPVDDVSLSYEFRNVGGRPAMPLRLSVFGVIFYTDLFCVATW